MNPQYRIEQYLNAISAAYLGDSPLPEYPDEPDWRIEQFLAAILSAAKGDSPVLACPDPVWRIEDFARAIYDAMTGASPAYVCPVPTNNIEAILYAIYKVVADGEELDEISASWDIERWLLAAYAAAKEGGGTDETVTGNAPIILVDALAKAIHSLTQYGLCTQASTPDPDAPVGIKCNNGTLTAVDDELPAAYKRVLGFDCNNNAMWAIPGFKLRGSDTVRISFSVTQACNVFGCYQGTDANDNYDLYVSTTSGSKYLRYGNGTSLSYWSAANLGRRFDVVFGPTGTQGMPDDSTWTEATFESANDMLIGSTTTTGTSSKLRGKLFGNIVVDGRLKLIPCERVSDGVLGYYDTYSETFFEPAAGFDGATSLGYDGSHYQLEVAGTPEVLTVSGPNLLNADTNITGKYISANGGISSGDDAQYTDLIPVKAGETYMCSFVSGRNTGTNRWHAYNANGVWVKQLVYISASGQQGNKLVMVATIDSGISYVRLSYGINDTEAMVEQVYLEQQTDVFYGASLVNSTPIIRNFGTPVQSPYNGSWKVGVVLEVAPGETYVVLHDVFQNGNPVQDNRVSIGCYESTADVEDTNKCLSSAIGTIRFTVPNGAHYAVIEFEGGGPFTFSYVGIAKVVDYQPYVPPQTASVENLLSAGDYKDEQEIISGLVKHKVGAKVLNGTEESWALSMTGETYRYRYRFSADDNAMYKSGRGTDLLTSHFQVLSVGSTPTGAFLNGSSNVEYLFCIPEQTITTLDDWKTWLAENPVIIVYPLAEETAETVTGQPLNASDGTNTISVTAEVSPIELSAVYKKARS